MTRILSIICLMILFLACKTDSKESKTKMVSEELNEPSISELIANAHGFENWKHINEIQFTFNVDRDSSHFERSWSWKPKTDDVILTTNTDTIQYNRKSVDSLSLSADKAFINDKFWLLVPFQLVWDDYDAIIYPLQVAPISKNLLSKKTIIYGNEGGYTPGDAYDIYFDKDYMIREWVYRKGNTEEPSMTTTFENYQAINGIKIAKDHKMAEGNFNLYFSNIKIK